MPGTHETSICIDTALAQIGELVSAPARDGERLFFREPDGPTAVTLDVGRGSNSFGHGVTLPTQCESTPTGSNSNGSVGPKKGKTPYMHIAVTGATGNIGSRLVDRLLADPAVTHVTGIARRPPKAERERLSWAAVDISRDDAPGALTRTFTGVDVVVHLAWLIQPSHRPSAMRATNVTGSAHVLRAVEQAGVPAVVHSSSLGVYSPGPDKVTFVPESWERQGIPGSLYSQHKVEVEDMLDVFSRDHPDTRIVRIRPAIVLQAAAAAEQARYFLGRLIPPRLIRRSLIPVLPLPRRMVTQVVHAADIADLFALAALSPGASGPYNGADEPILTPEVMADLLGARHLPVPEIALRVLTETTWRAHLQPTDRGWVELGLRSPLMDTARAADELGWRPAHTSGATLLEAVDGLSRKAGGPTPVLDRNA